MMWRALVGIMVLTVGLSGCAAREVDTLTALGFDRPRPDQFVVVEIPPLVNPPNFQMLPPRSEEVTETPVSQRVPASAVRRALFDAFSRYDEQVPLTRAQLKVDGVPTPGPRSWSPSVTRFLKRLGVETNNTVVPDMSLREDVNLLTTGGLTLEHPWVVRRLAGLDPVDNLLVKEEAGGLDEGVTSDPSLPSVSSDGSADGSGKKKQEPLYVVDEECLATAEDPDSCPGWYISEPQR